ncbi:MAG: CRISPR-associated CARF protein Csx1 [candidate division WOR-3 bacterium]|nr:CRISPR-associated CARF protein Csx1 [candidate division WOR-3 bacterium]
MKLLFEIWGNYEKWQKASYSYEGKIIESNTTLPLLYEKINPDYCYIIISDTLIDNLICKNIILATYKDYKNKLKEKTKEFLSQQIEFNDKIFDILILPGVGTFNNSKFIGNPKNFYSLLFYEITKRLFTILNNEDESIEFYIDITHGINYMTMITYRVLREISEILAFFYKVKFIVLNSDPKVGTENLDLEINKIEDLNTIAKLNFYYFNDNSIIRPSKNITNDEKRNINENSPKIDKEILNNIYSFIGSFLNALPIFIFCFFPDKRKILCDIEKAYDYFCKDEVLSIEENEKIIIKQKADFTGTFISILQAYLFSLLLNKRYSIENKKEVKFSEIEKLIKLFEFSRSLKQRLEKEIYKIKNIKNIKNDFNDLGYYLLEGYREDNTFDERNFYAHCGFGYNIIQIKRVGDDVIIKSKENFIERIKNNLLKNIPKGE